MKNLKQKNQPNNKMVEINLIVLLITIWLNYSIGYKLSNNFKNLGFKKYRKVFETFLKHRFRKI